MERSLQLEKVPGLIAVSKTIINRVLTYSGNDVSSTFVNAVLDDTLDELTTEEIWEYCGHIENIENVLNCKAALYAINSYVTTGQFRLTFGIIMAIAAQVLRESAMQGLHINFEDITNLEAFGTKVQKKCTELEKTCLSVKYTTEKEILNQANEIISMFEREKWFTSGNATIGYFIALGFIASSYNSII